MGYVVINRFVDLQDNRHNYREGDVYPREGKKVSNKRKAELAGTNNRRGIPLIAKTEEATEE